MFLEKQLKDLADSIGKDFREFKSVEAKLGSAQAATSLDPQIREAIEIGMLPVQKQQERRNTYILLFLGVLLALDLSPISVSFLVKRYFSILANSPDWTPDAPAWMMAFGILVVVLVLFCVDSLSPGIHKYTGRMERTAFVLATSILFAAAIILGYHFRNAAFSSTCYPGYCGNRKSLDYNSANISFNVATISGGLLVFLVINLRSKMLSALARRRNRTTTPPASNLYP